MAYAQGRGVKQDPRDAFFWYRVAADSGHPQAMRQVGAAYHAGLGVARDENAAAEWFAKAEDADPVGGSSRPVAARTPQPRARTGPEKSRAGSALAEHTLLAEDPDEVHTEAPFPATAKRLVFRWKLREGETEIPLEARWIAADTGRKAPSNHRISSSKSAAGKVSGEFTLTAPAQGFPPGQYRLELWHKGQQVHTEEFQVGPPSGR
jgi:hypothetical protein